VNISFILLIVSPDNDTLLTSTLFRSKVTKNMARGPELVHRCAVLQTS